MKKIITVFVLAFMAPYLFQSCLKDEYGPNDIRIYNDSQYIYTDVHVDTSEGANDYGTINPGEMSGYLRFKQSFSKADITLLIDGAQYKTDSVNFSALVPLVKGKLTYKVSVADTANKKLIMEIIEILPL